jgi:F0F1-type ATP synthase epsilon subunit
LKGINIIKAEIAKSMMAQPGASWQQLPPVILDGMGIVDQSEKQVMIHAIHTQQDDDVQQTQAEQQQAQQEAQAQQQQQGQIPQGQTVQQPQQQAA